MRIRIVGSVKAGVLSSFPTHVTVLHKAIDKHYGPICSKCHKRTKTAADGKCEHCGHWQSDIERAVTPQEKEAYNAPN